MAVIIYSFLQNLPGDVYNKLRYGNMKNEYDKVYDRDTTAVAKAELVDKNGKSLSFYGDVFFPCVESVDTYRYDFESKIERDDGRYNVPDFDKCSFPLIGIGMNVFLDSLHEQQYGERVPQEFMSDEILLKVHIPSDSKEQLQEILKDATVRILDDNGKPLYETKDVAIYEPSSLDIKIPELDFQCLKDWVDRQPEEKAIKRTENELIGISEIYIKDGVYRGLSNMLSRPEGYVKERNTILQQIGGERRENVLFLAKQGLLKEEDLELPKEKLIVGQRGASAYMVRSMELSQEELSEKYSELVDKAFDKLVDVHNTYKENGGKEDILHFDDLAFRVCKIKEMDRYNNVLKEFGIHDEDKHDAVIHLDIALNKAFNENPGKEVTFVGFKKEVLKDLQPFHDRFVEEAEFVKAVRKEEEHWGR